MRIVKGELQGSSLTYVPKAFGNSNDPDPIKVVFRVPTEGDKREIACESMRLQPKGSASEGEAYRALIALQKEIVAGFVTAVSGYEIRGKPITTGAELAEFGETELLAELAMELKRSMSIPDEGDGGKKASPEPSSSSPAATSATQAASTEKTTPL